MGHPPPEHFIVYWSSHAFPVHVSKLKDIESYIRGKYKGGADSEGPARKLFCAIPDNYRYLMIEMQLDAIQSNGTNRNCLYRKLGVKVHDIMFCGSIGRFARFNASKQRAMNANYNLYFDDEQEHERMIIDNIRAQHQMKSEEEQAVVIKGLKDNMEEYKTRYDAFKIPSDFIEHLDRNPHVYKKYLHRDSKFDQVGLACIDIETCMDYSNEESLFNMRPFLLHLYGRLQKKIFMKACDIKADRDEYRKETVEVDVSFVGFDCMQQFVEYMMTHGYAWIDGSPEDLHNPSSHDDKCDH
jgi:hypothetical protein